MTRIPKFACEEGCHACCGAVPFTDRERVAAAGRRPFVEWERFDEGSWVPAQALETLSCPFLVHGQCSIYDIRPVMCRLFGAVKHPRMICPKGRGPKRLISNARARDLIQAAR